MIIAPGSLALRHQLKSLGQQRVAGENGDAFAEHLVVGEFAAAEVIIIHRRQVVMNE